MSGDGDGVVFVDVGVDFLVGVGVLRPVDTEDVRGGGVGVGEVAPSFLALDDAVGDIKLFLLEARDDPDDGLDPNEL